MSDIQYGIELSEKLNAELSKQSSLLAYIAAHPGPKRKVTEEEIWASGFEQGMQRVVQAIHDLTLEWGAYCHSDD
jgi:hypothetical protein